MTPTVHPTMSDQCPHCRTTLRAPPHCGPDEVIICPDCHRAFHLALPAPDPETESGSIVLPPGVERPLTPAAVAAPQIVPAAQSVAPAAVPVAQTPESPGELIHLSMARRYPARCLAYLIGIVASIAAVVWCLTTGYNILAAIAGAVLAYLTFHVGLWWLRMRGTTLTITDRRVVIETGLFTRQATEIGRKDVGDVFVAQDPIMRLLDVGDLVIRSDKGAHKEVILMAVPHPETVVQKISVPPAPPAAESTSAA